jgi:hypothetical protein
MVFEIENAKMRNVGFMNPIFLLGRVLESLKIELLLSYFFLKMVKNSMENLSKRWKDFPMLCFPNLFLREESVSKRVFGQHNNAMNFFLFCIQ